MSAAGPLRVGSVVASRYELRAALGQGGMGAVYRAHDRLLNEEVALKVLRPDIAGSAELARRFQTEIKLARLVSHRNVCRIHEYGEDGDLRYITMAFVNGVDLRKVERRQGGLTADQAYQIAIQVADGLHAIHEQGIVHRDLKAANIMIDQAGLVRLMDFGIAKQWESAEEGLTAAGQIMGTPQYMSPEQIRGQRVDARSDVYSLGIVIYELFTGHTPFQGETPMSVLLQHLERLPPLEGEEAARLPPALIPLLATTLAKAPEDRFQSAAEAAQALRIARGAPMDFPTPAPLSTARMNPLPHTAAPLATPPPFTGVPTRAPAVTRPAPVPGGGSLRHAAIGGTGVLLGGIVAGVVLLLIRMPSRATSPPAAPASLPAPPSMSTPAPPSVAPPASTTAFEPTAAATPARGSVAVNARQQPSARAIANVPTPAPMTRPTEPPEAAARRERLLTLAEDATAARKYVVAIDYYDEVLRQDAGNARAATGRTIAARLMDQDAPAGRFVSGTTTAHDPARAPVTAPSGFAETAAVGARPVAQTASLPGKLVFEVEPEHVTPGDAFAVKLYLFNGGSTPIQVRALTIATTVNGRTTAGLVSPLTPLVGAQDKAVLLRTGSRWAEAVTSWSMSARLVTGRGEVYENEVAWK